MDVFEELNRRIKALIDKKGITLTQMCEEVGITPDGYRKGIRNESLNFDFVVKLAIYFNHPLQLLVDGLDNVSLYKPINDRICHLEKDVETLKDEIRMLQEKLD